MSKPWERYQQSTAVGPWQKYQKPVTPPPEPEKGLLEKAWDWEKEQAGGALEAGKKLVSNISQGKVFTDENAGLAGDVLEKGGAALLPAAAAAIPLSVATVGAVPTAVTAGLGMGLGYLGKKGGETLADVMDSGPGVRKLAGELGAAVAGGGAVAKRFNQLAAARNIRIPQAQQEAAEFAAKRADNVLRQSEGYSQLGKTSRRLEEGRDALWGGAVNMDEPALRRLRRSSTADAQTTDEFLRSVENSTAVARRPDAPQIALVEKQDFESKVSKLGKLRRGEMSGADLLSTYVDAKRQNLEVDRGKVPVTGLPQGIANRYTENQKFLDAYKDQLEPAAQSLDALGKEALALGVKAGLVSPSEGAVLASHPFWVPFRPTMTATEKSASDLLNPFRTSPVLGKGTTDFRNYLAKDLSRESLDPVQGMLDHVQNVVKMGARNDALRKVAEKSTIMDLDDSGKLFATNSGTQMFPEILVVPGAKDSKGFMALPEAVRSQRGAVPVWIDGKEHQVVGDPSLIKAFENWGSVTTDTAGPFMQFAQGVMRGANRVMKQFATGAFSPARKGLNFAYNYMQVYQQLPMSVSLRAMKDSVPMTYQFLKHAIGKKPSPEFTQLRSEGLMRSAFGSSSEIVRGVGEKNIKLLAAKGDPLSELPRYAIYDPARELGKAVQGKEFRGEVIKQAQDTFEDLGRKFEDLVSADEVGLRMAVYKNVEKMYLNKGYSPEQAKDLAAYDARNIITDFSKRGRWGSKYDLLGQPFLQAAMTGIVTNLQYAKRDPLGYAARSALPWMAHSLSMAMNYSDPKRREIMNDITPDTLIKNTVIIPDPDRVKKNEQGRYVEGIYLIPQPESSVSRLANTFNLISAQQLSDKENAANVMSLLGTGFKHLIPVEFNPLMMGANVPILGPLGEITLNRRTFGGAPIVNERSAQNVDRELPTGLKNAMDAMGASKERKVQANYFLGRLMPSYRAYNSVQPQGSDGRLTASGLLRLAASPFVTALGGEKKRNQREKQQSARIERQ